ncbi:MAG: flippase-like domain-containing protein [Candidatus Nanohaloarchaea archaeon]|nr:flippase-like domain-containing protein [Candidatus Nanohaloarchaea archaeon]
MTIAIVAAAVDYFVPTVTVISLLSHADLLYILLALGCVGAATVVNALVYRSLAAGFGTTFGLRRLVATDLKAAFMVNTVPSLGLGGFAVYDRFFRSNGVEKQISRRVIVLKNIANAVSFLFLLLCGFVLYVAMNEVDLLGMAVQGILTLTVVVGISYTGYIALERRRLRQLLDRLEAVVARFTGPAHPHLRRAADAIAEQVVYARRNKRKLVFPAAMNVVGYFFLSLAVYMVFIALGQAAALGTVIVGFISASWIGAASMLPGGVGAFETTMVASFRGVGIPIETAIAVALIYRVFSFWLPTIVGGLLIRDELGAIRDHLKEVVR